MAAELNKKFIEDNIMPYLEKKRSYLLKYLELTKSLTADNLIDNIEEVIEKRGRIINEISLLDSSMHNHCEKLNMDDNHALISILKFRTPQVSLPEVINHVDKACKIIYNIMVEIKKADIELAGKINFYKENLKLQLTQVNNTNNVLNYLREKELSQSQGVGNVLDRKN